MPDFHSQSAGCKTSISLSRCKQRGIHPLAIKGFFKLSCLGYLSDRLTLCANKSRFDDESG
ncbi:MAG: hypothetical protein HC856_00290 [Pseudanabaena sp. RU_4_16]|nr:hypothetical protein [Pseudanabaena sp. SU_2_4]NJM27083.1 hypothetical protein [Pseudanabaena sp. RU_4_16]